MLRALGMNSGADADEEKDKEPSKADHVVGDMNLMS